MSTISLVQQKVASLTGMVDKCREGLNIQTCKTARVQIRECLERNQDILKTSPSLEGRLLSLHDQAEGVDMATLAKFLPQSLIFIVISYCKRKGLSDDDRLNWKFEAILLSQTTPCKTLSDAANVAKSCFSKDLASQCHILSRIAQEQVGDGDTVGSWATAFSIPKPESRNRTFRHIAVEQATLGKHTEARKTLLFIPQCSILELRSEDRMRAIKSVAERQIFLGENTQALQTVQLVPEGLLRSYLLGFVATLHADNKDHEEARKTLLSICKARGRNWALHYLVEHLYESGLFDESRKAARLISERNFRERVLLEIEEAETFNMTAL